LPTTIMLAWESSSVLELESSVGWSSLSSLAAEIKAEFINRDV
jgi:hypothetical protein